VSIPSNGSLQEIRVQFEQDTSADIREAKSQGQKLINDAEKYIKELKHTCESLLKDTETQLAKGKEQLSKTRKGGDYWRTVKLANDLGKEGVEGIEAVEFPEEVSYEGLRTLANSLAPFLTKLIKSKSSYDPYITPYFLRARRSIGSSLTKLHGMVKELGEFTSGVYRRVHRIEKTLIGIDRLEALLETVPPVEDLLKQEKTVVEELSKRITDLQRRHEELVSESILQDTITLNQEIKVLELIVFKKLRVFRDPLKKMFYRSQGGGVGLTTDQREIAEGYIENSLETFRNEEMGHPILSNVLDTLKKSLELETVSLKKRKETKISKTIEDILDKNALLHVQEKIADLEAEKQKIKNTEQFKTVKNRENEILAQIEEIKATQTTQMKIVVKTEKEKDHKLKQIDRLAQQITKNIQSVSGMSPQITLSSLLPSVAG